MFTSRDFNKKIICLATRKVEGVSTRINGTATGNYEAFSFRWKWEIALI